MCVYYIGCWGQLMRISTDRPDTLVYPTSRVAKVVLPSQVGAPAPSVSVGIRTWDLWFVTSILRHPLCDAYVCGYYFVFVQQLSFYIARIQLFSISIFFR